MGHESLPLAGRRRLLQLLVFALAGPACAVRLRRAARWLGVRLRATNLPACLAFQ